MSNPRLPPEARIRGTPFPFAGIARNVEGGEASLAAPQIGGLGIAEASQEQRGSGTRAEKGFESLDEFNTCLGMR